MKSRLPGIGLAVALSLSLNLGIPSAALGAQDSQAPTAPDVQMLGGAFGLFSNAVDGPAQFTPATVVPLVEGQGYGWILKLRTSKRQVRWREEFNLPAAPQTWGEREQLGRRSLSEDSRVAITERVVEPADGLIYNSWAVAKGDPAGKYRIRVYVEGQLAATFEFEGR